MSAAALLRAGATASCQPWPRHELDQTAWGAFCDALVQDQSLDLLAMWADTQLIYALFHDTAGQGFLLASTAVESGLYQALSPARPAASLFERMIRDLFGHNAASGLDPRPWLDHGHWPALTPLSARPIPNLAAPEPFEFLSSDGFETHQIPVGPVHAGIIEPGHFRFTASGETIVRLEIRLGYLHKGILGLVQGKSPRLAARFAARLSGDSTVAHSLAFAHAAEAALGVTPPPRAVHLRAIMGEVERIANHLGDIGGIVMDAGFPLLPARFVWHREALLRATAGAFGHRLMMDAVIPGGVSIDFSDAGADLLLDVLGGIAAELPQLQALYDETASLADRMHETGRVSTALARRFAASGFVGRASGRGFDARCSPGYPPFDQHAMTAPVLEAGDVDARVRIRFAEITASLAMLEAWLSTVPAGAAGVMLPVESGEGLGWAEGFRGDIWHWLRIDSGRISAAFLCDPSWRQWPLLEAAVEGNIVADFPLCNKSFNCSYSGVDL